MLEKNINEFRNSNYNVNLKVISNLKNIGYGFSIKKGISNSINETIAIIDLDRTYKIDDLNSISNEYINVQQLKYDLIIGQRKITAANTSRLKIIGKTIINQIANFCFNEKIVDYNLA